MSTEPGQKDVLAIRNFQEYLRIPSVHPNINYDDCVKFLQKQAKSLELPLEIYNVEARKPIVIITWQGSEPDIPTVLLNSHMDVVPVVKDKWTYKPFGANIDSKGNIYARGAQDMKCVGIQYLEAIRRLREDGVRLRRTVHISFVPEDELGGDGGMMQYVHSKHFKELNVGISIDEGMANPTDEFLLFYGDRVACELHIHCPGQTGHGSLLLEDTAGEKVRIVIDRFMEFREHEKTKLASDSSLTIGDVTTVNLTELKGGIQANVIPPEFVVVFDCRIAVTVNSNDFQEKVRGWCREAGADIWVDYKPEPKQAFITKLDASNPFWVAFEKAADELELKISKRICPASSDSTFIRSVGIPAMGFSPMNNTPVLMHDHNEYLNKEIFLRGIEIYCKIIPSVVNV